MQDVAPVQSDENTQSSDTQTQEEIFVNRSAEELAKRLKEVSLEAKTNRQKYAEEKRKREELEKIKLADNGQYKELADVWQRKATEAELLAKRLRDAFAIKTVSDAVTVEATRMGCVDPDVLVNLLPVEQIPIDEGFSVDRASVKAMLEDTRTKKPYLFQKQAPRIADANPSKPDTKTGKPVEDMTSQELEKLLVERYGKK